MSNTITNNNIKATTDVIKHDFNLLKNEIIDLGYCVTCGGCEAVCPAFVIQIERYLPKLVGDCISCGACVDICLRYDQRIRKHQYYDEGIGDFLEIYVGRSVVEDISSRAQNGGIVTTILVNALNKKNIDSALVTSHFGDLLNPVPTIAMSEFEIRKAARSKYTLNPILIKLPAIKLSHRKKVAVVGLPCHNETLMNIIEMKDLGADFRVKYRIGLFCMSSYHPVGFRDILSNKLGLDTETLSKTDCARGMFFFESPDGVTDIKIKECAGEKAEGCKYCKDFAAELADISLGNVGVDDDSNIIIVRTEAGRELLELALEENLLDLEKIPEERWAEVLAPAVKLTNNKRRLAEYLPEYLPGMEKD
ncbi:MAG: Coenzyme F420 hydrogenase/dehydrogenase, beta subunit C-terminal domain [Candidatus Heimdallarchaeaceae archaeon]|jgi:coenzyme F420 hydrogenase subunit beta